MIYTVAQVSELTGLSKMSIYNRLKLKEIEPHITKKSGITYISEVALKLIQEGLNVNKETLNNFKEEVPNKEPVEDMSAEAIFKDYHINYLKLENERLWNELHEKNLQLAEKDAQILGLQKLVENGQVLLRDKAPKNTVQFEEHYKELDNKLLRIREQLPERKLQYERAQQSKGFFTRLFEKLGLIEELEVNEKGKRKLSSS